MIRTNFLYPGIALLLLISFGYGYATDTTKINQHEWNAESFQQAKDQHKLILIDVGTEWCGACQMMDWFTYTDAKVIELVKKHFVPIQVDAELQPDSRSSMPGH